MKTEATLTLWELIKSGGWVISIIILLSIITLYLIIKFLFLFRSKNLKDEVFERNLLELIEEGNSQKIISFCRRSSNFFARVIEKACTENFGEWERRIEEEGRRLSLQLYQSIRYLADIGVISPMLGLLGTVIGMIQAFQVVAYETGVAKPVMLAAGISKALVTTAAGLIVGIPAMAFYFYFRGKIALIIPEWERLGEKIVKRVRMSNK